MNSSKLAGRMLLWGGTQLRGGPNVEHVDVGARTLGMASSLTGRLFHNRTVYRAGNLPTYPHFNIPSKFALHMSVHLRLYNGLKSYNREYSGEST